MLRKNLHFVLILSSILMLFILAGGCNKEVSVPVIPSPNAYVRIINAASEAGSATFTLFGRDNADGSRGDAVFSTTVAFGSASTYFTVPAGSRYIRVQSGGLDKNVTLAIGSDIQYSLSMWAYTPDVSMNALYERYSYINEAAKWASDTGSVKFLNCLTDVASMSVALDSAKGTSVYTGIAYKRYVGYKVLKAKAYTFVMLNGTTEVGRCTATISANTRYTIAAFGKTGSVTVKPFTDDGK